jgi:carbamoyltransferase
LIDEFRKLTGIPVLLNTSFNNNVEPIVDSFEDAVVCYLTTKLHYLVVGDYLIKKKDVKPRHYLDMVPHIPLHIQLVHTKKLVSENQFEDIYEIRDNFLKTKNVMGSDALFFPDLSFGLVKANISAPLYAALKGVDGKKPLSELIDTSRQVSGSEAEIKGLVEQVINLWTLRLIKLRPGKKA